MRAGRAEKCWKEVSVAAFMGNDDGGAGVITTGICDLVFEENGRLILVDYKTDAVDPGSVDERAENYRPQLVAYSQAINKALGRPLDEVYLVFCSVVDGPIELNLDLAQ
jgi:ATP-dependent helicase/nuclease subunit A